MHVGIKKQVFLLKGPETKPFNSVCTEYLAHGAMLFSTISDSEETTRRPTWMCKRYKCVNVWV